MRSPCALQAHLFRLHTIWHSEGPQQSSCEHDGHFTLALEIAAEQGGRGSHQFLVPSEYMAASLRFGRHALALVAREGPAKKRYHARKKTPVPLFCRIPGSI